MEENFWDYLLQRILELEESNTDLTNRNLVYKEQIEILKGEINNKDYFEALKKERVTVDVLLEKTLAIPSEKIDNVVFKNNKAY